MNSKLTRRGVMGLTAGAGLAACAAPETISGKTSSVLGMGTFAHGVASGDPFTTSVVLWTHIATEHDGDIAGTWEISKDTDFDNVTVSDSFVTNKSRDYCVKIIATYDAIAKRADTQPYDALIHLGDYYYEYGAEETPRLADRVHLPSHEITSLNDYRQRHAQYRSDTALQAVTAAMPLIAVWDDHETSNDSWIAGAENHDAASEGDWSARKQAALRAYYEWMPIREPKVGRVRSDIYRNFRFGDLANLTCVETRLTARAEPIIIESHIDEISSEGGADKFRKDVLHAPDREMFGADQQGFILKSLAQSKTDGVTWRLLANQVIMGRLLTPDFTPYIDEESIQRIEPVWPGVRDFITLDRGCS